MDPDTPNPVPTPPKRGRGRPRKILPTQHGQTQALVGPAGVETQTSSGEVLDADSDRWTAPSVKLPPKGLVGNARERVAAWCMMRAVEPELSMKEAAARMGISKATMYNDIAKAVSQGWLRFSNPHDILEYQILPKVARNLNEFVDERDRTVTLETAKGTLFKTFLDSKGVTQDRQTTVLALKLEMPTVDGTSQVVAGKVMGRPRVIEAEITEMPKGPGGKED